MNIYVGNSRLAPLIMTCASSSSRMAWWTRSGHYGSRDRPLQRLWLCRDARWHRRQNAIAKLRARRLGRTLTVNEAKPREPRRSPTLRW